MSRTVVAMTPKAERAFVRACRAQEKLAQAHLELAQLETAKLEVEVSRMFAVEQPPPPPVRHDPPAKVRPPRRELNPWPGWHPGAIVDELSEHPFGRTSLLVFWPLLIVLMLAVTWAALTIVGA